MRVLIIRLGAFGDILHTLPLAADLVAAGHQVSWLAEDRWSVVLAGSPVVGRIHQLPRKKLKTAPLRERLREIGRLARELRTAGYDAVIDAQGLAKSALAAYAAAAPLTVGHARPRAREGAQLVLDRTFASPAIHVIDQQRDLGRLLGLIPAGPWRFPLPAWSAEQAWATGWLALTGLIRPWALNVGAGWPTKIWPEERQTGFLAALKAMGRPVVVLWGSPAERTVAERIIAQAGYGHLAPPTTIPQLAALISRVGVLVSGDTGPLHLALALGTPAVGLFGPVPAERNGPQGAAYRTHQAPGAAWERRNVDKVDMGAITVAEVIASASAVHTAETTVLTST
jgi:heptosyltransferase I